jgi:hypothetical protein
VGFVGGETGYCSETCVTGGVGGTGEGCVKVEVEMDIKEEMQQAVSVPSVKSEYEVRLEGVFEVVTVMLLGHLLPDKGNCDITLNYFLIASYCGCHIGFEVWIAILSGGDFFGVISINPLRHLTY